MPCKLFGYLKQHVILLIRKSEAAFGQKVANHGVWNLVSWREVSRPKVAGGLGLRSARQNNVALLGKLVDNFVNNEDKAWVKALAQKYLHNESILVGNYK